MYSSDVSGREWLSSIHKVGLLISRLKNGLNFIPELKVFFFVFFFFFFGGGGGGGGGYIDYQQKRCFMDSYYTSEWGYHLYMYTECVTKQMSRGIYLALCVKMKSRTNHMCYQMPCIGPL